LLLILGEIRYIGFRRVTFLAVEGDDRRQIEAAIEDARKHGRTTILGNDRDHQPWNQDNFISWFGLVRAKAVATATDAGDDQLAAELADLWFSDLRRSCVVILGELGLDDPAISAITGHKLGTIKTILETYMPRTEGMAARAVVARRSIGANVVQLSTEKKK
jgi:hypothetical protein